MCLSVCRDVCLQIVSPLWIRTTSYTFLYACCTQQNPQQLVNLYVLNSRRHSGSSWHFMPDKWQWLCLRPLKNMAGGEQVWGGVSPWSSQAMKDLHRLLWSSWVCLMKLFPRTWCPQTLELSASSANHSPPFASFLATCGQWVSGLGWAIPNFKVLVRMFTF